ncbi:hypothetical protein CASFOL_012123 [Castilleja foliolosa]|uniref:Uncharacterized protein n=1 Tax=Castilleja foliolosa TaxID=1961234 RepID=A0ABD3DR46_9LAMI
MAMMEKLRMFVAQEPVVAASCLIAGVAIDLVFDPADVDKYISAEIPDPSTEPRLHKIVTDFMIHGPCGLARPMSPCMRDSKCSKSKSFPKMFECNTRFDKDGYVHYRRRDSTHRASKNGILLDNRSQDATAVDADCVTHAVNEVQNFVDGRYICPHEASWRILNFPIHERTPAVEESVLLNLEKLLNTATPSKSLADFGLPMPSASALASLGNRLLLEESCYDMHTLASEHCQSLSMLNSDQLQGRRFIGCPKDSSSNCK